MDYLQKLLKIFNYSFLLAGTVESLQARVRKSEYWSRQIREHQPGRLRYDALPKVLRPRSRQELRAEYCSENGSFINFEI